MPHTNLAHPRDIAIDASTKRNFNQQHFDISAPAYDRATRCLSLGKDQSWKHLLRRMLPRSKKEVTCLDIACGTGDIVAELQCAFPHGSITGIDLSAEMVALAQKRLSGCTIQQGDMMALPCADESIDIVTGGYALRNAPDLHKSLGEIYRVLQSGGEAFFLDFSKSPHGFFAYCQEKILLFWGGLWGLLLHANPKIHGYIAYSFAAYPNRLELQYQIESIGFEYLSHTPLFGGMVSIIHLKKP